MRVAYVCLDPGVPVFGRKGSSVHCQEVIRALRQRGFDVELFATRLGDDVPRDLATVPKHAFRFLNPKASQARERALIDLNPQIYQALENAAPFDLVYERYSLWSHAAMEFAHQQCIPGVLEVNSPLIEEQKTYRTLHDETAARTIRGRCFRHATSLIAVSEQVAEKARLNYFANFKTTVIPNGVNCQTFQFPTDGPANRGDNKTVIGFVGTLKPWHGVSNLLEAFARVHAAHPEVVMKIVGDGPQRERLEHQISGFSARHNPPLSGWAPSPVPRCPKSCQRLISQSPRTRNSRISIFRR